MLNAEERLNPVTQRVADCSWTPWNSLPLHDSDYSQGHCPAAENFPSSSLSSTHHSDESGPVLVSDYTLRLLRILSVLNVFPSPPFSLAMAQVPNQRNLYASPSSRIMRVRIPDRILDLMICFLRSERNGSGIRMAPNSCRRAVSESCFVRRHNNR